MQPFLPRQGGPSMPRKTPCAGHGTGGGALPSWAGGMCQGKGPSIHPCPSVTALAFLGCERVSEQTPSVCPAQAAEHPCCGNADAAASACISKHAGKPIYCPRKVIREPLWQKPAHISPVPGLFLGRKRERAVNHHGGSQGLGAHALSTVGQLRSQGQGSCHSLGHCKQCQWDSAMPGSPRFLTMTDVRQSPEGKQGPCSQLFPWSVQGQCWGPCPGARGTALGGSSGAGRSG